MVLLVLVVHSWSLVIKDAKDNINKLEDQHEEQEQDNLEELRTRYKAILDQFTKKRSAEHPFGWGIQRLNTRDHPFKFGKDHPFSFRSKDHPFSFRSKDHPFSFNARDHPFRFRSRDHPFRFGLTRRDEDSNGEEEHPFSFNDEKQDSIPSNTQAFHGRDSLLEGLSDEDLEAANKLSEWLDEKIQRE